MKFYLQKLTYVGDICNLIGYSSYVQLVNGIQENDVLFSRLNYYHEIWQECGG